MSTDYERARQELDEILAGLMTEKNMKQNDKRLLAFKSDEYRKKRKELVNSKEYREKMLIGRKNMIENTNWLKNITEVNKKRANDLNWHNAVTEANRKKALDINWYNATMEGKKKSLLDHNSNYWNGIKNRDESNNIKKNKLLSSKQCITPYGIFWSRADVVKHIFDNKLVNRNTIASITSWVAGKFKKYPDQYYYITKEEYVRLTGHDPFNE